MKKNANILEKLKLREQRAGIDRITVNCQFFKVVKIIYVVLFSISVFMLATYCASMYFATETAIIEAGGFSNLSVPNQDAVIANRQSIGLVLILTAALTAGLILLIKQKFIASLVLNAVPTVILVLHLGSLAVKNGLYASLWKNPFLYEFGIPLTLLFGFAAWYLIVGIVHDYGENKAYNAFVSRLYAQHADKFDKLTDEEWERFLSEYEPIRPSDKKEKRKKKTKEE